MTRAIEVVRRVAPQARRATWLHFDSGGSLPTPNRFAHFPAQVLHECDGRTLEHESTIGVTQ
jgi:hypothetical protein